MKSKEDSPVDFLILFLFLWIATGLIRLKNEIAGVRK